MPKYVAPHPDAQCMGAPMISVLQALGDTAKPLLAKHGLEDVESEGWYSLQSYLDLFRELGQTSEYASQDMVNIGRHISENAHLPPEVDSADKALMGIKQVYDFNHRNGGDSWTVEVLPNGNIRAIDASPYPADMSYGIVYGFASRFAEGRGFTVSYEDLKQRKDPNAEAVAFVIEFDSE